MAKQDSNDGCATVIGGIAIGIVMLIAVDPEGDLDSARRCYRQCRF